MNDTTLWKDDKERLRAQFAADAERYRILERDARELAEYYAEKARWHEVNAKTFS
jgi:hypothetical protein